MLRDIGGATTYRNEFLIMLDETAQLRLKAEACRRLADLSDHAERRELWLKRADDWEELAKKAEKQLRTKSRHKACWPVE